MNEVDDGRGLNEECEETDGRRRMNENEERKGTNDAGVKRYEEEEWCE
jgi:hypothetical protein